MFKKKKTTLKHKVVISQPIPAVPVTGDSCREINLKWEPVRGARTYVIQKGTNSNKPAKWMNEDVVTRSSYTVTKLKSGRVYWFRVAAVGSWGQGPWSKPVKKKPY